MIYREEFVELLLQTGGDIALRRMGDMQWRQTAIAMASGPPLAMCTSGNYDADGVWHEYFRHGYSELDGPHVLGD